MEIFNHLKRTIQRLIIQCLWLIVRAYQLILSPILGSNCRFYPSCSHYCQEALLEHGIFKGLFLTLKRVGRCHPGSAGGFDPVPPKSHHSHG